MRKTALLIISVLILGLLYLWIEKDSEKKTSTINIEDRNFIVESKDDIHVVTIKNPGYPLMHLSRQKDNTWLLNNKYPADQNIMDNMVGVLQHMEIRYIPPKTMLPKILGELDQVGIDIKCYDKDGNLISDFIMGSNDNKELATFCVKRGATQAYAMQVAVAEGGLRNYFNMPERELKDKTVFKIDPRQIEKLSVRYFKDEKNSFVIEKKGGSYQFAALQAMNQIGGNVNEKIVSSYVLSYDKLVAMGIRETDSVSDSIRTMIPFAQIKYNLSDNTSALMDFYPTKDLLVEGVNTQTYEDLATVESYYVFNERGDVFLVQQRLAGDFFKPIDYFTR